MDSKLWLMYSILAGLCWGTYVPLVQQGIGGLRSPYGSFLCVGIAYFLIAVLAPIGLMMTVEKWPDSWNAYGITFATLAGVAGALGALCVIYANKNVAQSPHDKLYIAPIIFGLAPILNTLISLMWHPNPRTADPWHFGLEHLPSWKLYLGIVLTGIGAALVLYSKEEAEGSRTAPPAQPAVSQQARHT